MHALAVLPVNFNHHRVNHDEPSRPKPSHIAGLSQFIPVMVRVEH